MFLNLIKWLSIVTLLTITLSACADNKNKIKGRPPGVLTSAQESQHAQTPSNINEGEFDKKKITGTLSEADENNGDEISIWDESQESSIWKTTNKKYNPIFEVEGWPYQEKGANFRILAKRDISIPIYQSPTLYRDSTRTFDVKKESEIYKSSSFVAVLSSSKYRAKKEVLVEGYRFTSGYLDGNEGFSETLSAGETLEVLMYAGDGLCYLKIDTVAFEGLCPNQEDFQGSFQGRDLQEQMQARSRMWWIEIEGEGGWFILDEKFIVEIR